MSTKKRKPGRPKKTAGNNQTSASKKKRGRPRKDALVETAGTTKRKRGRPKKALQTDTPSPTPKRRGRPKKIDTQQSQLADDVSDTAKVQSTKNRFSASLDDPLALWHEASDLTKDISAHYSMRENERMLAFAYALTLPEKSIMVEIGVTHGKTGSLLAYIAERKDLTYYGIDNFTVEGNAKAVLDTFEQLELPITLLEGYSSEVPFTGQVDYLLIDGGHDLYNIRADCERWLPNIKPGGLVLFHEYDSKVSRDHPHWFVWHFAEHHTKHWIEVDYTPNLMIRRKPFE